MHPYVFARRNNSPTYGEVTPFQAFHIALSKTTHPTAPTDIKEALYYGKQVDLNIKENYQFYRWYCKFTDDLQETFKDEIREIKRKKLSPTEKIFFVYACKYVSDTYPTHMENYYITPAYGLADTIHEVPPVEAEYDIPPATHVFIPLPTPTQLAKRLSPLLKNVIARVGKQVVLCFNGVWEYPTQQELVSHVVSIMEQLIKRDWPADEGEPSDRWFSPSFASELLNHIIAKRQLVQIKPNPCREILATPTQYYNCNTQRWQPHVASNHIFEHSCIENEPSETTSTEAFSLVSKILEPDSRIVFEQYLACVVRNLNRRQVMVFGIGMTAANGKSTLTTLIQKIFGKLAFPRNSNLLETETTSGSACPELAELTNARAVILSEGKMDPSIQPSKFKALTGGDSLSVRGLYSSTTNLVLTTPMLCMTNFPPQFIGRLDEGVMRRVVCHEYKFSFVDNPTESFERQLDTSVQRQLELDFAESSLQQSFLTYAIECSQKYTDGCIHHNSSSLQFTYTMVGGLEQVCDWLRSTFTLGTEEYSTADLTKEYNTHYKPTSYKVIKHAIQKVFPDVKTNPEVVVGKHKYVFLLSKK